MKKVLSFTLALVIILSNGIFANADNAEQYSGQSEILNVLDQNAFSSLFYNSEGINYIQSNNSNNDIISYSYSITPTANQQYFATIDFTISINGLEYNCYAEGTCDIDVVNDNLSVINGALYGSTQIQEKQYDITVGFIKNEAKDAITACVSLFPYDMVDLSEAIRFSFGEPVITPEMLPENELNIPETDSVNAIVPYSSPNYQLKCTGFSLFNDMSVGGVDLPTGYASEFELHYDEDYGRVLIAFYSRTNNVQDAFDYLTVPYSTSLENFTIGLKRTDDGGVSIDGLDSFPAGANTPFTSDVISWFVDAAADLFGLNNIKTSVLENILNAANEELDCRITADRGDLIQLDFSCGMFTNVILDSSPMPVEINLQSNGHHSSKFAATGSVTYRTTVAWSNIVEYYFTYSNQRSSASVSLACG